MDNSEQPKQGTGREPLSRREFLARVGTVGALAAGAGAAMLIPGRYGGLHNRYLGNEQPEPVTLEPFRVELPGGSPRMVVVQGTDLGRMLSGALAAMGGIETFVSTGDVVVLKPNVAFDRAPSLCATTAPDLVAEVTRRCLVAGAREVRVLDNPINSPEGCFLKTGIGPAAQQAGAKVVLPSPKRNFQVLHVGGRAIRDDWPAFYGPLRDADKVIGLAPVKHHNLCHASITMKNFYGLLGGRRNQFHQRIHDVIADLVQMMVPTLVIADGRQVLMRNGPTGGSLSDVKRGVNTVVAGVDPVSVDAYCVEHLLGCDLRQVRYIHNAHERGLGNEDWRGAGFRQIQVG